MSQQLSSDTDVPLIELREAEKRYGDRTVLRIDKFELKRNDCVLIAGPNGSGKSTLMRVLSGVSVLSSGTIVRSHELASLKICFVPQAGGLHLSLTLAENMRLWHWLVGTQEPSALDNQWYIQGFNLQRYLHSPCGNLSGGFQRLAAFACAFATKPDGLFVDEPLSGIDAAHAKILVNGLAGMMRELRFLVMTSHSRNDFAGANRVVDLSGSPPR